MIGKEENVTSFFYIKFFSDSQRAIHAHERVMEINGQKITEGGLCML